ncbi:MAG TPA: hypothetical protein PKD54_14340 [Pirellulaceae bacterium]|nr:hypothetical protein [Pirellulaceae bacterium]
MFRLTIVPLALIVVALAGCKKPSAQIANKTQETQESSAENMQSDQDQPSSTLPEKKEGVFGRRTSDIREFDPQSGKRVSDSSVDENRLATPLVGSLAAYGPILENISKMYINQAVRLFHAEHGRYPKSYDEFMEKIVRANNIELPVLPGNAKYQYDVENHRLEVVEDKP